MADYPIFAQKQIILDSEEINVSGTFTLSTGAGSPVISYPGTENIFVGPNSGNSTLTGVGNSVFGGDAGLALTTASDNTFIGAGSGAHATTGGTNAACGFSTLAALTTGTQNCAFGSSAGISLTTGTGNTFVGRNSGATLTTATGNTFLGSGTGSALAAVDSNNILIGSPGVSGDSAVIRIGDSQTTAYLAGVSGVTSAGAAAAVINSDGKLGTVVSSRKRKRDIKDVSGEELKLKKVKIVSFKMKDDPTDEIQYGAIAEDVQPIMPECVVFCDGKKQDLTIQYSKWVPLLVKGYQSQAMEIDDLKMTVAELKQKLSS